MRILPQAYPIELVQFVFAHIGLAANLATIVFAFGDLKWVRDNKHKWTRDEAEYREFASQRNMREELARLGLNIIFASIGWVSIMNPPPAGHFFAYDDLTFQLEYTRTTLTLGSLFLTFKSVKDLTDRYALRAMMQRGRNDER